jgi:FAD/FMN-containing dehydrogenase
MCSEAGVPVVPYGAGTGLMGGARSLVPGIVLDTNGLQEVEVHPDDRFVWAGSGVILADLDAQLRPHGLCVGHDPWTFPVATVGGTLSTNSLGYKGGRYGGMGDQALALEVALADGTLFRTRPVMRNSAGPRFERLFIGAEGTLGLITAAALRAHPIPELQVLRGYEFERFEQGFAAIDAMARLALRPSLLDYGEEHESPWPHLVQRDEEAPILYLGFEGFREEVEASLARADSIVRREGGVEQPPARVQEFWDDRHVVAERFRRGSRQRRDNRRDRSPDTVFDYMHVALPASRVLDFRQTCHEETERAGVGLLECGLWTGPECFSAVMSMPVALGAREVVPAVIDGLLRRAQDYGGSMEYVHGAGLRYAHLMEREQGDAMAVLRRLKAALDPSLILNRGKLGL